MVFHKVSDAIPSICKNAITGTALGASTVFAVGAISGAAIPWAMTTFGTVVQGMGTIHIAASAGGIAANLQILNAGLLTTSAMTKGATVGACLYTVKPLRTVRCVLRKTTDVIKNSRNRFKS